MCRWEGKGEEEKGIDKATGKVRVEVDPKYYRPTEVVSGCAFRNEWCHDHWLCTSGLFARRCYKSKDSFRLGVKDKV